MITLTRKQQIIMSHLAGISNRQIASKMHMSKDTVNKYVKEYDMQRAELLLRDPNTDPEEILETFVEEPKYNASNRTPVVVTPEMEAVVKECLQSNAVKRASGLQKQVMRKKDIHELLNRKGFSVSYSTVKRLVNRLEERSEEAFVRQEYHPGEVCEFDWGEVKLDIAHSGYKRYQMAVFTAPYSGERYAMLYCAQDTAAFQEAHMTFFSFSHGAFHTMVYDNMKVAVRKFVGLTEKEPTKALLELSLYYGFQFRFCNIRRGNEKGHVERSVEVIRRKAFSAPDCDSFDSLEEANRYLFGVCVRLNRETAANGQIPADLFEAEQNCLLPAMPRFECCIRTESSVDKYATIVVAGNHYSVPDTLVGKRVQVRLYTSRLIVCYEGQTVAEHSRSFRPHDWRIDIRHYLRTLKRKPGALPGSTALLQSDAVVKQIYETYYKQDPRTFLEVLEVIYELGADSVQQALKRLERLSPKDMSARKVRVICGNAQQEKARAPGSDRLSEKARSTLSHYDLLRKMQMEGGAVV